MEIKIDIIVPHGGEPWRVCRGFFDMLRLQIGVRKGKIRIIIVHDGCGKFSKEQVAVPWAEVEQIMIRKGGVSTARNTGIENSLAEWVMFCDIDDRFANVWAVQGILEALELEGAREMDMLWMPFYIEQPAYRRTVEGFNLCFTHGKIYRRSFLNAHGIRFFPHLYYAEDSAFNALVGEKLERGRYGQIRTDAVPYVWTYNHDSVTNTTAAGRLLAGLFDRHRLVIEWTREHGRPDSWRGIAARVTRDAFYQWECRGLDETYTRLCRGKMIRHILDYAAEGESIDEARKEEIWTAAENEARKKRLPERDRAEFEPWLQAILTERQT